MVKILDVEEAIGELKRKWMQDYVMRDTDFLSLHMSEDYVGVA